MDYRPIVICYISEQMKKIDRNDLRSRQHTDETSDKNNWIAQNSSGCFFPHLGSQQLTQHKQQTRTEYRLGWYATYTMANCMCPDFFYNTFIFIFIFIFNYYIIRLSGIFCIVYGRTIYHTSICLLFFSLAEGAPKTPWGWCAFKNAAYKFSVQHTGTW